MNIIISFANIIKHLTLDIINIIIIYIMISLLILFHLYYYAIIIIYFQPLLRLHAKYSDILFDAIL